MANSIRTPRLGVTAGSRRIAEAVDNEEWQKFRLSMKGKSTQDKLEMLHGYWLTEVDEERSHVASVILNAACRQDCDICIRVDNYIKALCRGGQLYPGESLETAVAANFDLRIKRN